ncbi:hypothetical protein Ocin01_10557 [Orchesella cincta]|uniref:Uncharacterized protein n=1 Tax=Orchesella cincta TaxID=48709 RepID=A0A1D2MTA5_ORCCI|nr:hypothetical protein Ocin01_10557 [Orchesella cincta]
MVSNRDSLSTVHELGTLIRGSPKRMAQFNQIGLDEADETVSIRPRPLCPTRWTVRVKSVDAILSVMKIPYFVEICRPRLTKLPRKQKVCYHRWRKQNFT